MRSRAGSTRRPSAFRDEPGSPQVVQRPRCRTGRFAVTVSPLGGSAARRAGARGCRPGSSSAACTTLALCKRCASTCDNVSPASAPGGSRTPNLLIRSYPAPNGVLDQGIRTLGPSGAVGSVVFALIVAFLHGLIVLVHALIVDAFVLALIVLVLALIVAIFGLVAF